VEGKEEHGVFVQPKINLPQTKQWKIIVWKTFLKFVQLKRGRDLQYPIGIEELLQLGRKRRAWNFSNHTEIFHKLKC
jgi:hypothetical protein